MRFVLLGPQPPAVRLDNRTTDRQAHAHPALFRRKERLEYLVRTFDPPAAIADFGLDQIPHSAHAHPDNAVTSNGLHRIDAVAEEIDENLLNLDAVERGMWKVAFDIGVNTNATPCGLIRHEVTRFGNDAR